MENAVNFVGDKVTARSPALDISPLQLEQRVDSTGLSAPKVMTLTGQPQTSFSTLLGPLPPPSLLPQLANKNEVTNVKGCQTVGSITSTLTLKQGSLIPCPDQTPFPILLDLTQPPSTLFTYYNPLVYWPPAEVREPSVVGTRSLSTTR